MRKNLPNNSFFVVEWVTRESIIACALSTMLVGGRLEQMLLLYKQIYIYIYIYKVINDLTKLRRNKIIFLGEEKTKKLQPLRHQLALAKIFKWTSSILGGLAIHHCLSPPPNPSLWCMSINKSVITPPPPSPPIPWLEYTHPKDPQRCAVTPPSLPPTWWQVSCSSLPCRWRCSCDTGLGPLFLPRLWLVRFNPWYEYGDRG